LLLTAFACGFWAARPAAATIICTTLPSTIEGATGISGQQVVGQSQADFYVGVTASGPSYTPLTSISDPNAAANGGTFPYGISGGNITGYYEDSSSHSHGFMFNGSTYTTLDYPAPTASNLPAGYQATASTTYTAYNTQLTGISGSRIVGYYDYDITNLLYNGHTVSLAGSNGLSYDGKNWTPLTCPLGSGTFAEGISGNNIVGWFLDASGNDHGFIYNGSTYAELDYPGETNTQILGISGSDMVGRYKDSSGNQHGFLYDGSTFTTLDVPSASQTIAYGIDGNEVVGYCQIGSGGYGFIADVPEPSAPAAALGALTITLLRRRRGPRGRE